MGDHKQQSGAVKAARRLVGGFNADTFRRPRSGKPTLRPEQVPGVAQMFGELYKQQIKRTGSAPQGGPLAWGHRITKKMGTPGWFSALKKGTKIPLSEMEKAIERYGGGPYLGYYGQKARQNPNLRHLGNLYPIAHGLRHPQESSVPPFELRRLGREWANKARSMASLRRRTQSMEPPRFRSGLQALRGFLSGREVEGKPMELRDVVRAFLT